METESTGAVYVQTNDAGANEVVVYRRDDAGRLAHVGRFTTGGAGTGKPHLPSQGSLALARGGSLLLVANAGSNDVTIFAIADDGLAVVDRVASRGERPTSIAVHDDHVYVLNAGGDANVAGFRLSPEGNLVALAAPVALPPGSDPAQVAFTPDGRTLVVTDRASNSIITFGVDEGGSLGVPSVLPSSGATPYGFDFAGDVLVVTEAFGGAVGAAAASSYRLGGEGLSPGTGALKNTRSEG